MIAELLGLTRREHRYDGGYSLENPNLPLNDPAVWEQVFNDSYGTDTGISVTAEKALMYAPFYRAVNLISSDVAKLPRPVYKRRPDLAEDARERDRGHRLNYVLNVAANEHTEAIDFWTRFMADALIWTRAYARIMFDGTGSPAELYNLLPDRTQPEWIDGALYYVTEINGKLLPLFPWEVLKIEGPHPTGLAKPLFQLARNSIALGLAQEKFASKFFKNGARVGGILELPQAMQKTARDTIEDGFRKTYEGGDNPFKTVILRDGAKFHSAQTTPRESQMAEATEAQTRQIAHWFNLPPSKLGLSDSVSYNSKAEDNQNYLDTTLQVWLARIESACNFRLISTRQADTHFIEHNTSKLLRMNRLQMAQVHQIDINARIRNPNECRSELNMLPYDGGDEYLNPNPGAALPGEIDASKEPEKEPEQPPEKKPADKDEAARNRVLFGLTKLARYRAQKGGASFCDWLDHDLPEERKEAVALLGTDELVSLCVQKFKGLIERATDKNLTAAVETLSAELERGEAWKDDSAKAA